MSLLGSLNARRLVAFAAPVVLLVGVTPAVAAPSGATPPATTRLIVQLTGAPALAAGDAQPHSAAVRAQATLHVRQRVAALQTEHTDFRRQLAAAGIRATVRADLTQVSNTVAVSATSADAARLRALPDVVAVYPDSVMHASAEVDPDVSITGAPQVWQTQDGSGVAVKGKGETIAVLDTGISYSHPDLGSGFGPGHKVVGGYDFVNNDADPADDNGHGTHVAGIIAGQAAEKGGRTGEAPEASLTAYKVLDWSASGFESTILEGLEAAVSVDNPNRADVVNLSLSGPAEAGSPLEQACEDAVHAGVVVVAAAGDDGPGDGTVSSPAEAPDVLAVGASITGIDDPTVTVTRPVSHALTVQSMSLSANPPAHAESVGLVDVGLGTEASFDAVDVTGKAVLASYNRYTVTEVTKSATAHGAVAVLFRTADYWGRAPQASIRPHAAGAVDDPDKSHVVTVMTTGSDGTDLLRWLAEGPVRLSIGGTDATDEIPNFSAHGPAVGSYALKPDLVAPGVEIGSTWLGGRYRDDSGTSMAAPHVAGAAALLMQAHPTWTAGQVAAALTGGAHVLNGSDAVTQGAGRLDVAASDRLSVLADETTADLGLADMSASTLHAAASVTLTNVSTSAQTLSLGVTPAAGSAGQVTVSPSSATIAPGAKLTVRLRVGGAVPSTSTDITGWLRATSSAGQRVSVAYLLAVRPLQLHATPDPAPSASRVLIQSEPDIIGAPIAVITSPNNRRTTATATPDELGGWTVPVPDGPAGVYQIRVTARAGSGAVLLGSTTAERLAGANTSGAGRWQSVGPDSIGAAFMTFTSRPGLMYAIPDRTEHAGVFRTEDGGQNWQEITSFPIDDGYATGIAADPKHPDTVYLALNSDTNIPTYRSRLLVSHDAGATWAALPVPDVNLAALSIDPTGRILTAASGRTALVSLDRGQTWAEYPGVNGDVSKTRIIGHDLYFLDSHDVYVVRDVDSTPFAPKLLFTSPDYLDLADLVGDGKNLFTINNTQVFVSRNSGASWRPAFTARDGEQFVTTIGLVHGDVYVGASQHIWVDRGEGTTWTPMATPVPAQDVFIFGSWDTTGKQLVVSAMHTGVFVTSDKGASYARVGLTGAAVRSMAVAQTPAGRAELVAGTDYNSVATALPLAAVATAKTRDWGVTEGMSDYQTTMQALGVDPADHRVVYAAVATTYATMQIERSTDGGQTWTVIGTNLDGARAFALVVDPADPNYLYVAEVDGASPGIVVSTDGGKTWRKNDQPPLMTALAADPNNPNRIWLGGPTGLYRSDDRGQTMTRLSSVPVSAIAIDPRNAKHLIVGGSQLYDSRDGGRTLTAASVPGGYRTKVSALLFGPNGTVYAGTDAFLDPGTLFVGGRGVLASVDSGRSWANISAGLGNLDIESLAASPDSRWLYAGTVGGGVYRVAATRPATG